MNAAALGTAKEGIFSLMDETRLVPGGIASRTLVQTPNLRLVLFGFAAGQELTEHTSAQQAMVQILDGECEFSLGGAVHRLKAGDLVWMPPNLSHAVKATRQFSMLLTLVKPAESYHTALPPTAGRIPLSA
jgi:quercetin dioxygenase-like cupin family protein